MLSSPRRDLTPGQQSVHLLLTVDVIVWVWMGERGGLYLQAKMNWTLPVEQTLCSLITILVIKFMLITWCFCPEHVGKYYKNLFQMYLSQLGESALFYSCDWHLFLPNKFLSIPSLPPCRSHFRHPSKCGFLKIRGSRSNIPQNKLSNWELSHSRTVRKTLSV